MVNLIASVTLQEALLGILTLSVWFLLFWFKKFFPAYFEEKGKNLATKEDLAEITHIAEAIKTTFLRVSVVHKAQFEVEFQAYQKLWALARKSIVLHIQWRPLIYELSPEDYQRIGTDFIETSRDFSVALFENEPFVPTDTFNALKALEDELVTVKADSVTPRTYQATEGERAAINKAASGCAASIRSRLASLQTAVHEA